MEDWRKIGEKNSGDMLHGKGFFSRGDGASCFNDSLLPAYLGI